MLIVGSTICGLAFCQAVYQLYTREIKGNQEIPLSSQMVDGPQPGITFIYRAFIFVHMLNLGVGQLRRISTYVLRFFTVWNFWLEITWFFLAAVATGSRLLTARRAAASTSTSSPALKPPRLGLLDAIVARLYYVALTGALLVSITCWTLLWPLLSRNPKEAEFVRPFLFNFCSYNQHGGNAVFLLLDGCLNRLPPDLTLTSYLMGFFQLLYMFWVVTHHLTSPDGKPLYPFLDLKDERVGLWMLVLYAGHWAYCYLANYLLAAVRRQQGGEAEGGGRAAKKRE